MQRDPVIPLAVVDERIRKAQTGLDKAEVEMGKLAEHIQSLKIELDLMYSFRQSAIVPASSDASAHPAAAQKKNIRLPTAEALYYILEHKPGLTYGELVRQCEAILDSDSSNKRQLLKSTVSTWKRKGRFVIDENGGFHLKKVPGVLSNGNGAPHNDE